LQHDRRGEVSDIELRKARRRIRIQIARRREKGDETTELDCADEMFAKALGGEGDPGETMNHVRAMESAHKGCMKVVRKRRRKKKKGQLCAGGFGRRLRNESQSALGRSSGASGPDVVRQAPPLRRRESASGETAGLRSAGRTLPRDTARAMSQNVVVQSRTHLR
jgi:hypothetical protein